LENAAVAVAILEKWSKLVGHISTDAIVTGLTECEWPARMEWLRVGNGELLIDAAHNPAGAAALASYLQDTGSKKLPIVFAAMADKDLKNMIAPLLPVASAFIATTVPNARARSADQLAADIRALAKGVPVEAIASPEAAVARALELARRSVSEGGSHRAVACGSIYMIGPLRARLIAQGATRA
jgi:dihydrofolate synthase/folylpolyglutamate synthase